MKKQTSGARTSIAPLFSAIVKENHKKVLEYDLRLITARKKGAERFGKNMSEAWSQIDWLEAEQGKAALTVVVFAAMALEAYIYDYAARQLGDMYVKNHLEKLDVVSKWVVIPELVTGRELPGRSKWYPALKELIKARNGVIHHKSSTLPVASSTAEVAQYFQNIDADSKLICRMAKQSAALLGILADRIAEIDPEETPWVQSYLT